jgi:hypothetical protein
VPTRRLGFTNDRILIANLDSTVQASLVGSWKSVDEDVADGEDLLEIALAGLRVESLLSQTIVLTDAHVFDGGVITQLAVAGKLTSLQRLADEPLPIDLRLRHPDASRALFLMYHHENDQPKAFLPSLFTGGESISAALEQTRRPRIRRALRSKQTGNGRTVDLLRAIGVDGDELARADTAWQKLLELVRAEQLPTSTWGSSERFPQLLTAAERYWPVERLRADHCLTAETSQILDTVVALGTQRSAVHTLIKGVRDSGPNEETATAVDFILHWYDERYRRAQAFQHEADYRGSDTGLASHRSALEHMIIPRPSAAMSDPRVLKLQVPPGLLEYLGALPLANWQFFIGSHLLDLRRWWQEGDVDALSRVFDALSREADAAVGRPVAAGQSAKVFGSLIEKLATLPFAFDFQGASAVLLLHFAQSYIESAALASPMRASVEITDYFDEIVL